MSSYESFSDSDQSSQDYSQSLGLKIHIVVGHLKHGMIAMSLLLLMIVVSPLGLIVSQARILSKLLPTPNAHKPHPVKRRVRSEL